MSLIIENGKVIKATGNANQIVADFNEYLKFVRETTIPVPKDRFTRLNENRAKLYRDHVEAIKANKDLQEEIKNLKHAHTLNILENNKEASTIIAKRAAEIDKLNSKLNELQKAYDEVCASKEKLRIENSKIFRERDILQRECKELNEKCNVLQKAYDDVEVDKKSEDEEANNDLSSKSVKVYDNSSPYKTGDLAFIIERSCEDPTDDSTTVVHVTLAMYTGILWHSLDMRVLETDFADIVPIHNAEYLKEYFGREDIASAVKFHY